MKYFLLICCVLAAGCIPNRQQQKSYDPCSNPYSDACRHHRNPYAHYPNEGRVTQNDLIEAHNRLLKRSESLDLAEAAQRHAEYMAESGGLSHYDDNNQRIDSRCGHLRYTFYGENIAYGYRDLDVLMGAWMRSSGHKRNILNDRYTDIGVGVAYSSRGTPYYCVVFGG